MKKNINLKGCVEEMDVNLPTMATKENDLEWFVDTCIEELQSECRKTFRTISAENNTEKKKLVPWWIDGRSHNYAEKDKRFKKNLPEN
jgi:hypothetical protein